MLIKNKRLVIKEYLKSNEIELKSTSRKIEI